MMKFDVIIAMKTEVTRILVTRKFLIIIILGRNKYINFMADSANGQDGSPQVIIAHLLLF